MLVYVVNQASQPPALKAATVSVGLDGNRVSWNRSASVRQDEEVFHEA